jgi:hypothetical protein
MFVHPFNFKKGYFMMTNEELKLLESTKSLAEWDAACDTIQKAHGGYPSDWYEKVLRSGLANRVLTSFGSTDQIQAVPLFF